MIASPTDFVLVSVAHGPVELSATTTPIDLRWRREMETVSVEFELVVKCVCGTELRQVAVTKNEGLAFGITTTVTPCAFCQREARDEARKKGLEEGIEIGRLKEENDKGLRIGMMGDRLRDAS